MAYCYATTSVQMPTLARYHGRLVLRLSTISQSHSCGMPKPLVRFWCVTHQTSVSSIINIFCHDRLLAWCHIQSKLNVSIHGLSDTDQRKPVWDWETRLSWSYQYLLLPDQSAFFLCHSVNVTIIEALLTGSISRLKQERPACESTHSQ